MIRRVVLHKLGKVRSVAEALSDCLDVRAETIRRYLRAVDDALPIVIDERACRGLVPLAGDERDDRLARGIERRERVLVALVRFA